MYYGKQYKSITEIYKATMLSAATSCQATPGNALPTPASLCIVTAVWLGSCYDHDFERAARKRSLKFSVPETASPPILKLRFPPQLAGEGPRDPTSPLKLDAKVYAGVGRCFSRGFTAFLGFPQAPNVRDHCLQFPLEI